MADCGINCYRWISDVIEGALCKPMRYIYIYIYIYMCVCVCVCVCVYPLVPADISVGTKIGTGDNCLISLTPRSRPKACIIHVYVRHQSIAWSMGVWQRFRRGRESSGVWRIVARCVPLFSKVDGSFETSQNTRPETQFRFTEDLNPHWWF